MARDEGGNVRLWGLVFALALLASTAWSIGTPLMTGPDEVSQLRRAAAAARGQWTGTFEGDEPPILVDVKVPAFFGDLAHQQGMCFVGPVVESSPQEPMVVPKTPCPDLAPAPELVVAPTVQGRGQPILYLLAGLPTRWSAGPIGAHGARIVVSIVCSALIASATCSAHLARRPRLAGLGLLLTLTPSVIYLTGTTNPSGVEITAAIGAWMSGAVLASGAAPEQTSVLLRRTMAALVVLVLTRGMSPLFGGLIVLALAWIAGWERCLTLMRRRDFQLWSLGFAGAVLASGAWLLHIRAVQPTPPRLGSGFVTAVGYVPWYLHQSVGVFGNNDSDLPMTASAVWVLLGLGCVVVGALACSQGYPRAPRAAVVAIGCLLSGLVMQISAEGLNMPDIGFYWQGRYALPLLFGALLVASACAGAGPSRMPRTEQVGSIATVIICSVIHLWAFVEVARHHGGLGGGSVGVADALVHTAWDAPLPLWLIAGVYLAVMAVLGLVVISSGRSQSATDADRFGTDSDPGFNGLDQKPRIARTP